MGIYQPKLVETEPVTVTVGGFNQPPASQILRIDIPDPDKLIQFKVRENEDSDDVSTHPEHIYNDKRKKKKRKENANDQDQEVMKKVPEQQSDPNLVVFSEPIAPTPMRKKSLTEYALVRILKERYCFGCYGSALYVRNEEGVYSEVSKTSILTLLLNTLSEDEKDAFSSRKATQVRDWLLADSDIKKNQLVFPVTKVLFNNGCYDIVSGNPVSIDTSDFFITKLNARFLPKKKKLSCPYFDAYLESTSGGDKSIQRRICAMIGYLLLSGYPGKKILVLGTAKNSGKSLVSRFIQRIVGAELVSGQTPFDMTENHASAEFSNKILNAAMDVPAMTIKPQAVGLLKTLSGGDIMSANPKGQPRRSQICYTKQMIGTNAPLQLQIYDEAFWARVVVIPYAFSIPNEEQIFDLEERLYHERNAIVTKCMRFARQLVTNNYEFPECPMAEMMKDQWIGWQAHAGEFLRKYCVVEEGSFTPSVPLYHAYSQYCATHMLPCGEMTGFIRLAKKLFPSEGTTRIMQDGIQQRGPCGVRFTNRVHFT